MSVQVVTPIMNYMDTVMTDFVSQNLSTVITAVTPVVGLALTASLTVEGAMMMYKPNAEPLGTLMERFFRWGIILSVATAGGLYQDYLVTAALKVPNEFANLFVFADKFQTGSTTTVGNVIDSALDKGLYQAGVALSAAGLTSWSPLFAAVVIFVSTLFICGVGTAFIIMAKFLLSMMVCLGPVAIFCLLFKSTTNLFGKWIGTVIHYGLVTVLISIVFGVMQAYFAQALQRGSTNFNITAIFTYALIALVGCMIMKQVPEMAARLSEGVQVAVPSIVDAVRGSQQRGQQQQQTAALKTMAGHMQQAASAAGAAGGPAGAAAAAAGQAASQTMQGMARGSAKTG